MLDKVAMVNHFHVVKWIHENREERCSEVAMVMAAHSGYLDMFKWLHDIRKEFREYEPYMESIGYESDDSEDAMNEWLISKQIGCSVNAMNYAAAEGHLDVVQWLHEHRGEGCTFSAMDGAAADGHLQVVRWLQENRIEGCTYTRS